MMNGDGDGDDDDREETLERSRALRAARQFDKQKETATKRLQVHTIPFN
jgi:hypothetical protein